MAPISFCFLFQNAREQPKIALDESSKDFFNFHGILSTNQELNRTYELITDADISNSNGVKQRDGTKPLDLISIAVKDELTSSLVGDFEELDAELEWSDNDVKDDTSLSNASLSSSGINESEATAGSGSLI
jgi:hypothetical protein